MLPRSFPGTLLLLRPLSAVAAVGLVALCAGSARAQIVTDRPNFVESSRVVSGGSWQLETGLAFSEAGDFATFLTPTLLRWGLSERVELRVESALFGWSEGIDEGDFGLSDVAAGTKVSATSGDGVWEPSSAFLFHLAFPTGTRVFRGEGVRPSLRYVMEWSLPRGFGIGVMPGIMYDSNSENSDFSPGEHFWAGMLGVVVGWSVTSNTSVFGELAFARLAEGRYGGNVGTWDFGITHVLSPETQIDLSFALPATDSSVDYLVAVGFAKLWGP